MVAITETFWNAFFLTENVWISINIHRSLFLRVNQKYSSIGWDNGMALARRQAIERMIVGLLMHMRHSVSMS